MKMYIMKTVLIASITLACIPTISYGQSDLEKIGRFLQDVQQIQSQNQRQQPGGNPVRSAPSYGNPNSSGNMNAGGFQNDNLFGPPDGEFTDNSNFHNDNTNNFRPQNQFPQNNSHQGRIYYPNNNNATPGHNHYPDTIYHNYPDTVYNNNVQTYPGTSRPVYLDPPVAPKVYSNLPIVIRCAQGSTGTCSYNLVSGSGRSFPYTIRAGEIQNLKESTDWKFSYQSVRGASNTYALRGGRTYELRQTGEQWQFYLVP